MRADMDLDAMRLTLEEARALAHSMRTTDRLVSWICDNTSGGNSKPGDLEARLQAMLEQRRTDNEKFDAFVRTSEELNIKYDSLQAHHASEVSRLQADTELLRSQADALREKLRDARGELATTAEPRGRQRKRAATFKSTARLRSGTEASRGRKRDASV